MSNKPHVKIENWYLIAGRLYGNVHHHPNFEDGELVRTSTVIVPDNYEEPAKEGDELETRKTFYTLGTPGRRHETSEE